MTRSTRLRLLTAILVMVGLLAPLMGPGGTPASAVADVQAERIGGANRFETAANVARAGHPSARTALIANGLNFPDALAGSYLAGALGAPILLVLPNAVPEPTTRALSDLGVQDVVILGGPNAVGPAVEAQLRQRYGVSRVQGGDRYQTAVEAVRRGATGGIGTVNGLRTAFLTTGTNFPDALGAGSLAYEGSLPVFLTRPDSLPGEVAQAFRDLNIEHVVILGGTQAVSSGVETAVRGTGATTERLAGRNRAETATLVADFALTRLGFEGVNVLLARGDDFPDALAGGPLGGVRRAVIVLTATPTQLAVETRNWLEDHFGTVARITALGGPAAISDAVLREAEQAAETNNLPPSKVELTISGGSMNGGPEWQYQQSNASPSKSLTLSAFVSSDPPQGSSSAERVPAAREDVVFNIRPTQGDNAANQELNLTARTDSNGIARVSYTRGQPGTDTITVRLADDPGINDTGTGRWNTDPMPLSLAPDTPQTLAVNQNRTFTACRPGPSGSPTLGSFDFHLTTLELIDDNPNNDTNIAALRFTGVTDDRADSDQTIGKVTLATGDTDGCVTFSVGSNAAQIFTLMAFEDNITTPAASDDNLNQPEYRDIAGQTAFLASGSAVNISPATDNNDSCTSDTSCIRRRNGQQIVYTVSVVDSQGQPLTSPVDVSFRQITDESPVTTTTAEFDWFDNSASPSNQAGLENETPPNATATPSGTTRIEVTPNAQGRFTFAITHPRQNTNTTEGNPIAWLDIPGGTNNRPDSVEPQAVGENFQFNPGSAITATLESLGCPPGTPQRGTAGNPLSQPDPCLGRDVNNAAPHVPWPLDAAATSPGGVTAPPNASTSDSTGEPNAATISRGDIVFRFTYRDILRDPNGSAITVLFEVTPVGTGRVVSASPNRPNPGSQSDEKIVGPSTGVIPVVLTGNTAEIVVDATTAGSVTVRARIEDGTFFDCITGTDIPGRCSDTASWVAVSTDTTTTRPAAGDGSTQCQTLGQPCFNGNVIAIDKARDYYVMNRGGFSGGTAYVVYAAGGGGRFPATGNAAPDRPGTAIDEYFIDGLSAAADVSDDARCGHFPAAVGDGCARFDAALTFDDRLVYEWGTSGPPPPNMTQTHFLSNGTSPTP